MRQRLVDATVDLGIDERRPPALGHMLAFEKALRVAGRRVGRDRRFGQFVGRVGRYVRRGRRAEIRTDRAAGERDGQRQSERCGHTGNQWRKSGTRGASAPEASSCPGHEAILKTKLDSTIIDGSGGPYKGAGIGWAGGVHTLSSNEGANNGQMSCPFSCAGRISAPISAKWPRDDVCADAGLRKRGFGPRRNLVARDSIWTTAVFVQALPRPRPGCRLGAALESSWALRPISQGRTAQSDAYAPQSGVNCAIAA